jgi:Flp pilus assembly pilin Flp
MSIQILNTLLNLASGTPSTRGFERNPGAPAPLHLLLGRNDGSVAVEYGLIAAFVVLAIIVGLGQLGTALVDLPLPRLVNAFQDALS